MLDPASSKAKKKNLQNFGTRQYNNTYPATAEHSDDAAHSSEHKRNDTPTDLEMQ